MRYSISETAKLFNITTSQLRYYEKQGVIPPIKRDKSGKRYYDEGDLDWISVVMCMKTTNMSIENLRRFAMLNAAGDETLQERLDMVICQKEKTEQKIKELEEYLEVIRFKEMYFYESIKEGTEANMKKRYYASHIHAKVEKKEREE